MDHPPGTTVIRIYPLTLTPHGHVVYCQICVEPADDDMGEFALPKGQTDTDGNVTILAHGQCGLDHGLETA